MDASAFAEARAAVTQHHGTAMDVCSLLDALQALSYCPTSTSKTDSWPLSTAVNSPVPSLLPVRWPTHRAAINEKWMKGESTFQGPECSRLYARLSLISSKSTGLQRAVIHQGGMQAYLLEQVSRVMGEGEGGEGRKLGLAEISHD